MLNDTNPKYLGFEIVRTFSDLEYLHIHFIKNRGYSEHIITLRHMQPVQG